MGKPMLSDLPPELLNEIAQYLPHSDLSSFTQTNKRFYNYYIPKVWKRLKLPSLCFRVDTVTNRVGFLGNNAIVTRQIDVTLHSPRRKQLFRWTKFLSLRLESTTFPRPPVSEFMTCPTGRMGVLPIQIHCEGKTNSEHLLGINGEWTAKLLYKKILGTFSGIDRLQRFRQIYVDTHSDKGWPTRVPSGRHAARSKKKDTFNVLLFDEQFRECYESMIVKGVDRRKRKIKFFYNGELDKECLLVATDLWQIWGRGQTSWTFQGRQCAREDTK
ncbi:MAG: hypothetical protein MMC33_009221 [Icmadophila ericetorum]|nr:hypothetical protein [Icmadophila ericetorum]